MNNCFKWVRISEDGDTYTEIMDLVHSCVMRVFSWDCEKDEIKTISLVKIDRLAGQYAIAKVVGLKKAEDKKENSNTLQIT